MKIILDCDGFMERRVLTKVVDREKRRKRGKDEKERKTGGRNLFIAWASF